MKVTTVGIELAKNVFGIHGADEKGRVVVRKVLSRRRVLEFLANLPKCLVGMEACASAHYWTRDREAGTQSQVDCTAIREALREGQQERRERRRGHLRGGHAPVHALGGNQDSRTTGSASAS